MKMLEISYYILWSITVDILVTYIIEYGVLRDTISEKYKLSQSNTPAFGQIALRQPAFPTLCT